MPRSATLTLRHHGSAEINMTNVSFLSLHDSYYFECSGHAEYASAGRDILCSAVSILCYTLGSYTEKLYNEGVLNDYRSDFSDGQVRISFCFADGADERAHLEAINAILCGFELLSESFPDYVLTDM